MLHITSVVRKLWKIIINRKNNVCNQVWKLHLSTEKQHGVQLSSLYQIFMGAGEKLLLGTRVLCTLTFQRLEMIAEIWFKKLFGCTFLNHFQAVVIKSPKAMMLVNFW